MSAIASLTDAADLVAALPYGLALVDRAGVARPLNEAAVRLLPPLAGGTASCADLFEAVGPDGESAACSLAERAADADGPLPEIRLDTSPGAPASALWVTAVPLADGNVLFHLRPGDARDRRRRSDPHWLSGPELRIRAFGRTLVDSGEGPLGGQWLQQRPGLLLKYLIAERNRVVHAEEIADALWPSAGRQGVNNVRHFMHALRAKLEPDRAKGAPSSFIVTVQGGYALDRRRVKIDADVFDERATAGLAAAGRGEVPAAIERLESALAIYSGDLLSDEPYAEWVYAERERLRARAAECLRTLVRLHRAQQDLEAAGERLERLAELEPFDDDTHRELLGVCIALGRRTEASRRFQAYRARMAREFGAEPAFTLSDLTA